MSNKFKLGGPGVVIAAAFIGPGTVTVCTLAGATHGLQLLWAVLLSIGLTILFQEMASRLGIVTQLDLTTLIKNALKSPVLKTLVIAIVLSAVVIGNGAYEAGNISGGALGVNAVISLKWHGFNCSPLCIGAIAFVILWLGNVKYLTVCLTFLVALLSVSFVVSAILVQPDLGDLFRGLFIPIIPEGGWLTVLGVIGTTVVPYNLFLHTSLAKSRWTSPKDLAAAKRDTIMAVTIGGLVSMAIVVTASALKGQNIAHATDMAEGLVPIFGKGAKYLIALGLFAAGITSAITAPLAAAYVMAGGLGWEANTKSRSFRLTWMTLLGIGVLFSSIGYNPIAVIRFAQVTNGLILPIVAILLVWLCNQPSVLGDFKSQRWVTIVATLLIVLLTILGLKSIWLVVS